MPRLHFHPNPQPAGGDAIGDAASSPYVEATLTWGDLELDTVKPTGSGDYTVQDGDCITSIADAHGHFWETLWQDPANATLKNERKDPNVLIPGDKVTIMPLREKKENGATEQRHRFKKRGIPAVLRLDFRADGNPRKNEPYRVSIDGAPELTGNLDGNGMFKIPLPPRAERAVVIIGKAPNQETFSMRLGGLDPAGTARGVLARMYNLGLIGEPEPSDPEVVWQAIYKFQAEHDLEKTGRMNAATRDKLVSIHGC